MSDVVDAAKAIINGRKQSYSLTFTSAGAKNVLKDLAKFCRANESAFHTDPRAHAVLEGRREVWLRIQNYLNLSSDELWELFRKE